MILIYFPPLFGTCKRIIRASILSLIRVNHFRMNQSEEKAGRKKSYIRSNIIPKLRDIIHLKHEDFHSLIYLYKFMCIHIFTYMDNHLLFI